MAIEAILFDFGGTLDSNGKDWFARLHEGIEKRIGQVPWEIYEQAARQAADEISLLEDTPQLSLEDTARRLCQFTHSKFPADSIGWDPHEIAQEFIDGCRQHLQANLPILKELHQNYRLGCISNNWGNAAGWCNQFGLDQYFETIIDSSVVGCAKPDKAIFMAALAQLGLPAASCAYVGDKYESDILGAYQAGLLPVWMTNGNSIPDDEITIKPHRISAIDELLTISW